MRRQTVFLLGSIAACAIGCRSVTEPLGDRLALRSIGGVALPAEYAAGMNWHGRLVADTLILSNGAGQERVIEQDTPTTPLRQWSNDFSYVVRGDRVEITFTCPPNASCIQGPQLVGHTTAAGFVVDSSNVYRTPLTFDRVTP